MTPPKMKGTGTTKRKERTKGKHMTDSETRLRLAEIKAMAAQGDFSYDFGEYVLLTERLPEERAANEVAAKRQRRRAQARKYRL